MTFRHDEIAETTPEIAGVDYLRACAEGGDTAEAKKRMVAALLDELEVLADLYGRAIDKADVAGACERLARQAIGNGPQPGKSIRMLEGEYDKAAKENRQALRDMMDARRAMSDARAHAFKVVLG